MSAGWFPSTAAVALAASALAGQVAAATLPRPVRLVRADLAERMHVPLRGVTVVRAQRVVWPDSCLGLPAPELCAQGLVPGFRVTLAALGQRCVYHTNLDETFRYAGPAVGRQLPGRCGR